MAEATRYSNVIKSTADGDSITGPVSVLGIKAVAGANAVNFTIKDANSNVLYQVNVAANASAQLDSFDDGWQLRSGQTYIVGMSATGGSLFIYVA